nr:protein nrt1/ ptr family 6.2 [Quercus suber]
MNTFVKDAVDQKGNPADMTKTGSWLSAAQILGTMHLPSASASNFASTSRGTSYLLCLFGGIVADSFIGRYWTIAIAAAIHAEWVFFYCLDKAAIITSKDFETPNPWRLCTVTNVEEVKMLIKLLPIWATTIIFWPMHAQLASFSVQQSATMDRSIGNFQIPAASLYAFFVVAIMITLAIYDRLIMPLMKKSRNSQGLTNLQKVGLGLFFSILGMAAAALVEKRRLSVVGANNRSTITRSITLPISAFFLLPQFILVGIGEAFILSGELDFFTNNAPNGMKAITTGLCLTTSSFGIEICERFATMAIIVNLVTYLVGTMHLPSASASNFASTSGGTAYLLSLLGGIVADSFLGRYWMIAIAATIHAAGTCLLAISTSFPNLRPPPCNPTLSNKCVEANSLQMGIFTMALYLTNIGVGGIKSSVAGLGTDQFDQNDDKEKAQMAHFFNRFYFVISSGTLLAVTVLVYLQDQVGRSWAYGICSASMTLALLVFLLGTKRYRYKQRLGTPIVQILQVIVAAVKKRKVACPSNDSALYEDLSQESRIYHSDKFRYVTIRIAA